MRLETPAFPASFRPDFFGGIVQPAAMENRFARAVPQLPVHDVKKTQEYYRDVLGFHIDWLWGENDYGSVSRDETTLYLSNIGDREIPRAYFIINVGEVDHLCAEWKAKGANIVEEPADKPWGLREFTLQDINGHCFRISKPSDISSYEAREPVTGVTLLHRKPTGEEYRHLIEAVGWTHFTNFETAARSLAQSAFCVVAEKEGRFIGMARLVNDDGGFYYVMDVAVLPEHQRGGVGTALMNELVTYLQTRAPEKAMATLFTGANLGNFYRKFGFEGPETWLYGMGMRVQKLRRA